MKKHSVKKKSTTTPLKIKQPKSYPLYSLLSFTLGLLAIVSFWDYTPEQSKWVTTQALDISNASPNLVGAFGVNLAFWMNYALGLTSWLFPIYLFWIAYMLMTKRSEFLNKWRFLAIVMTFVASSGLLCMLQNHWMGVHSVNHKLYPHGIGGLLGHYVFTGVLKKSLGFFGSGFILVATSVTSMVLSFTTKTSPNSTLEELNYNIFPRLVRLPKRFIQWIRERLVHFLKSSDENFEEPVPIIRAKPKVLEKSATLQTKRKKTVKEDNGDKEKAIVTTTPLKIFKSERIQKTATVNTPQRRGDFIFPSQDLLFVPEGTEYISEEEHRETVEALVQTLSEFGINVTPGEVHTGPVVTRYEVTPAPGVRVEKIANLDKNIALSLKAHSVRILAPVPGKGTVGIEIPNRSPSPVCLREIIESTTWSDSNADIPIVLGKEVTGKPLIHDLAKMPHLLIAGSTGSGKTVCINAIITSLLYHASPRDLRFLMIDPKIVEMKLFNDLPHMLIPVVTEAKKVPAALKWLIKEMEHRYQIFATSGVRNIAGFNAKILKDKKEREKAKEMDANLSAEERAAVSNIEIPRDAAIVVPKEKLPYIVCIVDELADLMIVAPAEIETCIMRLAQLARAAGIHLILATQRPSVNVITGVIKANLPCRIAFKVSSKVDSRTILDAMGADQLIGRGDMLFVPPGISELIRAQGAYVSDPEITSIIEALKVNGPPQYADDVQRQIDFGDDPASVWDDGTWDDDLVPAALEVIYNSKRASTSMLQRRLKIGYNRAARIMEELEQEDYVGPDNGPNPREILREELLN